MEKWDYEILTSVENPNGLPTWFAANGTNLGAALPQILDTLGRAGWEMIGAYDVAKTDRPEIFFKRRIL